MPSGYKKLLTVLDALTATGSSQEISLESVKKVTLFFTRADHVAGVSTFDVDVSLDSTTYVDYNKLISNVANTNVQTLTRVASVALAANGTTMVSMDLVNDALATMVVNVVETTDGTHTCKVLLEY